jgi:hypothetical protein
MVETKMHFSIFAKMRKSCEHGTIFFAKTKINFRENAKTKIFVSTLLVMERRIGSTGDFFTL